METNFPNVDLGLAISFPPGPEEKMQKKEELLCLPRELDELVEEAQAKSTKYATKYAVKVFQGNFCI